MRKIPTLFFAFIFALSSMFSLAPRDEQRPVSKTYTPGLGKHFEAVWRYIGGALDK